MINPIVESVLDTQLVRMLEGKIPNYHLLRKRVPGIDRVMLASPEKIVRLYSNANNEFDERLPYYEQNWLWFGSALYQKLLVLF